MHYLIILMTSLFLSFSFELLFSMSTTTLGARTPGVVFAPWRSVSGLFFHVYCRFDFLHFPQKSAREKKGLFPYLDLASKRDYQ